jgi:hypothetical protein
VKRKQAGEPNLTRHQPAPRLPGVNLREYGNLDIVVRDSHEPCQTVT